ncbi:xanthine dehydrogenase YagR molybdenum-binding subunit [Nakamurella flavida]|uniref:xanthine dehydrogenase family protein molybdopterin-binding subunit n=1 Tax=Nakamurella flavida TaxID=363630 RepID=UPI00277DA1CC|nr:xanthine dehydrogenase family protein molybdopterin-binding subunit [Nakamurella flavida]MDP9778420.1 xanthine dehydrogenase YagR molybdenum-binding subunit [Nakamurella flavida]
MTRTVTPTTTSTATLAPDLTPPQPLPAALGPAHRVEGRDKVTGRATYAAEYGAPDGAELTYGWPVQSTIASGRITAVDVDAVAGMPGVVGVLWHGNAPRLVPADSQMINQLQSTDIHFRGEVVALVLATSPEAAREAAAQLPVTTVARDAHSVLTQDDPGMYEPETVNPSFPGVSERGDAAAAFATSPLQVDAVYRTPGLHNNAMEPHATTAVFGDGKLTVHDSNQGGAGVQEALATALRLPPENVRVITTHIGGGFGSKGTARPVVVLAAMAAMQFERPVRVVFTRQHMFALVGYRTPTIQHLRLGAGADGRLTSISHESITQTARHEEFAEQVAVATRVMYGGENRSTRHHLTPLDVPIPSWMRAPGECPGMFALESAMDELAIAAGLDPVELRIRNEPARDPELDVAFSSRHLVDCLRRGAELFGWAERDPTPRARRDGRWWVGTGMAAATYPAMVNPAQASVTAGPDGRFEVSINATDIGTGARTTLLILAAEALDVATDRVRIRIGDTSLPPAGVAGGSAGTSSWGWAVAKACRELRTRLAGRTPEEDVTVTADTEQDIEAQEELSRHAFGAHFVEVRVDGDTGEVRVSRALGVFAAGRIVNPVTARSQFLGGMTMGLSMALHEEGLMDPEFGDYANHDLATYHVASIADVPDIQVEWLPEDDSEVNLLGTKGIGEIGIVGVAAAVANAVHHAVGVRVRELPVHLEDLLPR